MEKEPVKQGLSPKEKMELAEKIMQVLEASNISSSDVKHVLEIVASLYQGMQMRLQLCGFTVNR